MAADLEETVGGGPAGPRFDPDALREKYRRERDKRVRQDGNDQYIAVQGQFAHFLDDPYGDPGIPGIESFRGHAFHASRWDYRYTGGDGGDGLTPEAIAQAVELADFEKMEEIRARVDAVVEDPETAAALKPFYRQFCKRPCFHNEYLPAFNRSNVTLVDTRGQGVDRITPRGVMVRDQEYELDCLIFATGFEVGTDYCRRADLQLLGRHGKSLSEAWSDGVRTLHGMHVHGFPNCFIMNNTQSGFTASYPHMLDEQAKHIAYIVKTAAARESARVEATAEGEERWVQHCIDKARSRGDYFENCTPGYYNNEGRTGERNVQNGFYGGGPVAYFHLLRKWRDEGSLEGLALG